MVDFVQGEDGGEFLIDESVDYSCDILRGPVLQGLFEGEA